MADKKPIGCGRPTGGLVGEAPPKDAQEQHQAQPAQQAGGRSMIKVGQKAPDFEAPAYYKGDFTAVKLSDHLGKWVVLCFYPGDFTFV